MAIPCAETKPSETSLTPERAFVSFRSVDFDMHEATYLCVCLSSIPGVSADATPLPQALRGCQIGITIYAGGDDLGISQGHLVAKVTEALTSVARVINSDLAQVQEDASRLMSASEPEALRVGPVPSSS